MFVCCGEVCSGMQMGLSISGDARDARVYRYNNIWSFQTYKQLTIEEWGSRYSTLTHGESQFLLYTPGTVIIVSIEIISHIRSSPHYTIMTEWADENDTAVRYIM
jgi:hypothetical protein